MAGWRGRGWARVSELFCIKNPNHIFFFFFFSFETGMGEGGDTRVRDFFHKKSKSKKIFFGMGGVGWGGAGWKGVWG